VAALARLHPSLVRFRALSTDSVDASRNAIMGAVHHATQGALSVFEAHDGWSIYLTDISHKATKRGVPLTAALLYVPLHLIPEYSGHSPTELFNALTQFGVMFKGIKIGTETRANKLEVLSRKQLLRTLEKARHMSSRVMLRDDAQAMHGMAKNFLLSALGFTEDVDVVQVVPRVPYDVIVDVGHQKNMVTVAQNLLMSLKSAADRPSVVQLTPVATREWARGLLHCPSCHTHHSSHPYGVMELCGQCLDRREEMLLEGTNALSLEESNDAVAAEVVEVTDKDFEQVVLQSPHHVLLEVYAPWCPHCIKLAPEVTKLPQSLGQKLTGRSTKVIVAKMDGTANKATGAAAYPTFKLFKAGEKLRPVVFNDDFEIDRISEWVMDSLGAGISLPPWMRTKPQESPAEVSEFDDVQKYAAALRSTKRAQPAPLPDKPSLRREYFQNTYGAKYGHDGQIEHIRDKEFSRLQNMTYLDSTGSGLYQESQIHEVAEMLKQDVFGNTHSLCQCSKLTQREVDRARAKVLRFFKTDTDDYHLVFTGNASGALKAVGEYFPFQKDTSAFIFTRGNHNSVLGIREYAHDKGAHIYSVDDDELAELLSDAKGFFARRNRPFPSGPSLFAFPGEDNFHGAKYPLQLAKHFKAAAGDNWKVLLDAAALAPNSPVDLGTHRPDFVALSFYKMFGYPTGLGALVLKADVGDKLNKVYFGGGNVAASTSKVKFHAFKSAPEKFEDGTLSFLSIASLRFGLERMQRMTMPSIKNHTWALARYLADGLQALKHSNGQPVIEVYGKHFLPKAEDMQGPVVSFNVLNKDGTYVKLCNVLSQLSDASFQLRTGEMCNPGSCFASLGIDEADVAAKSSGNGCGTNDFINGKPVGAVRASVGYFNTFEDMDKMYSFMKSTFVQ